MRLSRLTLSILGGKERRPQKLLGREIGFMLLLKIILLCALWFAFFSHRSTDTEVVTQIADRLAGSGQTATSEIPRPTQNREKP